MSVIEKKSRRTLTSEPPETDSSSNSSSKKIQKEDKTPTPQRLVYVSADPVLEAHDTQRRELGEYFTRLVKGYIYGKKVEDEKGEMTRLWKEITPWPIEFVHLGHPDVLNVDLVNLYGSSSTMSAEQFVNVFKSEKFKRQLERKSGPGLVHGWIFNFDRYIEDQEEDLNGCLNFLHAIVRDDKATWASMHAMYSLEFDAIRKMLAACVAGNTSGVASGHYFKRRMIASDIHRLAREKPDTTDWKELSNRWTDDVLEPLSMLTSPPNADRQRRMLETLDLVLGKESASIVASDMKRCLLPPERREQLQPSDARFAFAPYNRRLLAFGLLWKLVEAAPAWNQRYWPVAQWPLDFKQRWFLINKDRIFNIHYTYQEENLAGDSDVDVYNLSMSSAKELASQLAEVSPQMRKDRLIGGNLMTYTSIKGGSTDSKSRTVHPFSKLTGRGRLWPDSKSGGNKTPGTVQVVTSFLGKASDQELRNTISRFEEEEEEVAKRQRDYNTDTVGSYQPFLSTSSSTTTAAPVMSAGARLQTSRKKLLLSTRR